MPSVLNLGESLIRLDRAKRQYSELVDVFNEWTQSGGIAVQTVRHPRWVCYLWNVAIGTKPSENLPLLAGEIVNNVRAALEYVAFQIYLVGGGTPDGEKAGSVAFPIRTTDDGWDSIVAKKVPGVWPAAANELKVSQPFDQDGEEKSALPVLQGLGGTDKHRNLVLCAAAAFSGHAIWPAGSGFSVCIQLARAEGDLSKGPVVPIEPGTAVEVARVYVQPDPAPYDDAVLLWVSGIQFNEPETPRVEFSFRANNGSEASVNRLGGLIAHVERIVHRFAEFSVPPPDTGTE
jgi:hypothetical protein